MAKVPFSKLQACINGSDCKNFYCNKNGEEVYYEVKRYLPLKEKLDLVSRVINQSIDDNGFYNPMRVKMFTVLEVVYAYTNLSFTEKMKEDLFKLYDILISTGIFTDIVNSIGENELKTIEDDIKDTIDNIYKYKNSIMGILDTISSDYNNLSLEAADIQKKLTEGEGVAFLQDVMSKLG